MKSEKEMTADVLRERLLEAVENNNVDQLILLLQATPEIINAWINPDGETLLHHAICQGLPNIEIIKLLLQYGADPKEISFSCKNALSLAVRKERSNEIILVIFNSAKSKKKLLYQALLETAVCFFSTEELKILLNLMPKLDQRDRDINKVIDPKTGDGLLNIVIQHYYFHESKLVKVVQMLVQTGADPLLKNKNGLNSLCIIFEKLEQWVSEGFIELYKHFKIILDILLVYLPETLDQNMFIRGMRYATLLTQFNIRHHDFPNFSDMRLNGEMLVETFIQLTDEQTRMESFKSREFNYCLERLIDAEDVVRNGYEYEKNKKLHDESRKAGHLVNIQDLKVLRLLLNAGAYVNQHSQLRALLNDLYYPDPIFSKIKNQDDLKIDVEEFIEGLRFFCRTGNFLNIEIWLEYGRKLNIFQKVIKILCDPIGYGWIPDIVLYSANYAFSARPHYLNSKKILSALLLVYLAKIDDFENAKVILEKAVINVNTCLPKTKKTALLFAVENNNAFLVKTLLDKGADPNLEDSLGKNSLDWLLDDNDDSHNPFASLHLDDENSEGNHKDETSKNPWILLYLLESQNLKIKSKEQYFKIGAWIFGIDPVINPGIYENPTDQFFQALKYLYLAADSPDAEKLRDYCILALVGKKLFNNTLFTIQDYEVVRVKNTDDYKKFFVSQPGKELIECFHSIEDNEYACYALGDIYSCLGINQKAIHYFDKSKLHYGMLRAGKLLFEMQEVQVALERIIAATFDDQGIIKDQRAFDYFEQNLANPNKLNLPEVQLILGNFYFNQANSNTNSELFNKAIHWLTLAANQNSNLRSKANLRLAQVCESNNSIEYAEKAFHHYKLSIMNGNHEALSHLILVANKNLQTNIPLEAIKIIGSRIVLAEYYLQKKQYTEVISFLINEKMLSNFLLFTVQASLVITLINDEEFNKSDIFEKEEFHLRIFIDTLLKYQAQIGNLSDYFLKLLRNHAFSQRTNVGEKALFVGYIIDHAADLETLNFGSELKSTLSDVIRHFFQTAFAHEGHSTLATELPELHYLKALALNKNTTAQYLLGCFYLSKGMEQLSDFHFAQAQKNGHPLAMHATSDKQLIESWQKHWKYASNKQLIKEQHQKLWGKPSSFNQIMNTRIDLVLESFRGAFENKISIHLWNLIHSFLWNQYEETITFLEKRARERFELFNDSYSISDYNSKNFTTFFESVIYNDAKKFHELFGFVHFIIQQICREAALQPKLVEDESEDEVIAEIDSDQESKSFS